MNKKIEINKTKTLKDLYYPMGSSHLTESNDKNWAIWERVKENTFPYLVSKGILHNCYSKTHPKLHWGKLEQERNEALGLWPFLFGDFSVSWQCLSQRLTNTSDSDYYLPRSADLLCNIQVSGGTFARIGNKHFEWNEKIERWILPELTPERPLLRLGERDSLVVKTDGLYLWYLQGFVNSEPRHLFMKNTSIWSPDWFDE